ncbi:DUF1826 domain-containing protein [Halioxenophilus aromaticivorans]|uniref:DUF1826 domain-containing protein n=1 Tax=Halioxenophilus aromaticivorans TaxID=1306992 RepID=UPI0031EE9EBC
MQALTAAVNQPPGAVYHSEPEILAEIYQHSVNMACWQRDLSTNVSEFATFLVNSSPDFQLRSGVRVDACAQWLERSLPSHAAKSEFIEDVSLLTDMFACLFQLNEVGVRLAVLHCAMCPKFHVDYVPCRLLCTYAGVGTHWRRAEQGDDEGYQQLSQGDVALLKGENWEGNENFGLIHRSPQATPATGRVVLSLDFA